jgi:amidase
MKIRVGFWYFLVLLTVAVGSSSAQTTDGSTAKDGSRNAMDRSVMDRDLLEVTIPRLEELYRGNKYTVTEVVQWYMARIARYNGIYRAVETLDAQGALATAAREDAEAKAGGSSFRRGPLWGVPVVIKANTSIKGMITTDGWKGYTIPGHQLVAPKDATIVAKLRAAGAVILGHTNMPDFAASDTNRSTSYGRTGNAYDVRFSPGGSR